MSNDGAEEIMYIDVGGSYDTDVLAVFQKNGELRYDYGSSCSCYGPFDDFKFSEATLLTKENYAEFEEKVRAHAQSGEEWRSCRRLTEAELQEELAPVKKILRV